MNATKEKEERSEKFIEIDNFVNSKTKDEVIVKHTAKVVWLEKINMKGKIDKRPCQKEANTERLKKAIHSFEKDVDDFVELVEDNCGPAIEVEYKAEPFCKTDEMIKALVDKMPKCILESIVADLDRVLKK